MFIDDAKRTFSEAFIKSNASLAMSTFFEDSVILPPDMSMIEGEKEIEEFWRTAMASGIKDVQLYTNKLLVDCDLAFEMGTGVITICPMCGILLENKKINYIIIWKCIGGDWKNMLYAWNVYLK